MIIFDWHLIKAVDSTDDGICIPATQFLHIKETCNYANWNAISMRIKRISFWVLFSDLHFCHLILKKPLHCPRKQHTFLELLLQWSVQTHSLFFHTPFAFIHFTKMLKWWCGIVGCIDIWYAHVMSFFSGFINWRCTWCLHLYWERSGLTSYCWVQYAKLDLLELLEKANSLIQETDKKKCDECKMLW